MSTPGPRPFPELMRVGIARNLGDLRSLVGMSQHEVAPQLGWSSHNELARYERVTETRKGTESNVRPISVHRYAQLMKFYAGLLPKHRDAEPGFLWIRSPEGQAYIRACEAAVATAKARGDKHDKGPSMVAYLVAVDTFVNVGALSRDSAAAQLVARYVRLGAQRGLE